MTQRNDRARWLFFLGLAALYAGVFFFLRTTTLFDTGGHNDRLFSADDLYYVTKFFSTEMDTSPRIIKHPLLIVFGCLFTRAETLLLGAVSLRRHYQLIVLIQMGAALLSTCGAIVLRHGVRCWCAQCMRLRFPRFSTPLRRRAIFSPRLC